MSEWKEEYREAGQNFREGFKLMFEILKGFVTTNSFLFAAYAAVNNLRTKPDVSLSTILICFVGFLTTVGFGVGHWRIAHYLRGFVLRAKEIEQQHEFEVFTRVYEYEIKGRRLPNNVYIPIAAEVIVGLVWIILPFVSAGVVPLKFPL